MTETTLKSLLDQRPVFAPCVYDCLSSKIVEEIGFKAMCLSGGNLAMSLIGVPDIHTVTRHYGKETAERAYEMALRLPELADVSEFMRLFRK